MPLITISALGLTREATSEDIKKAYIKLARQCHSDKNHNVDPETQKANNDKFSKISEAYHVLMDEEQRKIYDRSLDEGKSYDDEKASYDKKINALKNDVFLFFDRTLNITNLLEELKKDEHDPIYQTLLPMYEALNREKDSFIEQDFNLENLKNFIQSCETTVKIAEFDFNQHENKSEKSHSLLKDVLDSINSFISYLKDTALNLLKEYSPHDYKLAARYLGPTTQEREEIHEQGIGGMQNMKRKIEELRLLIPQSSETQEEERAIVEYRGKQP